MKLLYLITKSEFGGAQTHVAELCNYFKTRGYDISVMSAPGGWLENECNKIGLNFIPNEYFSNSANPVRIYKAIRLINKCVEDFNPDLVHCHSSAAAIIGRLAIRGKIKTIYTAHGWGFNIGIKSWIKYPILLAEKFCAHYTDKYICVSEFVKKLALKYSLAPEEKFVVIHNGVELPTIGNPSNPNKIRLIFVGRLANPKNPELIIEAISLLPEKIKSDIEFTIIGNGPKRDRVEKMAKDKKVNVNFFGSLPKEKVLTELKRSDIFVFVSDWEGFPYTIIEAMSCALPVIASDVGGIREALDESSGILINNNVDDLRQALIKIINDKKLASRMGQSSRERIKEKFTLKKMLEMIEEVYKTV